MNKPRHILTALAIFASAAALLAFPQQAAAGAKQGLLLSANIVIPTLFPFMAIAGFLALSGSGGILAWPLLPITRYLLKLPDEAAGAVLMSFVGGYPTGAKALAALHGEGSIDSADAARMLCFCVNAGPGFLVSAVGGAMYSSPLAGWVLLLAQIVSSVVLGALLSRGRPLPKFKGRKGDIPLSAAFVEAVSSAATAMLSACAFIVFFSVVGELVGVLLRNLKNSLFYTILIGLMEVTKGCAESAGMGGAAGFGMAAFFVGFGGVSVLCQVAAIMRGSGVSLLPLLLTRPLAGAICAGVALPVYHALLPAVAVIGSCPAPLPAPSEGGGVGAACLVVASVILLLSCRRDTVVGI